MIAVSPSLVGKILLTVFILVVCLSKAFKEIEIGKYDSSLKWIFSAIVLCLGVILFW